MITVNLINDTEAFNQIEIDIRGHLEELTKEEAYTLCKALGRALEEIASNRTTDAVHAIQENEYATNADTI